MSPYPAPLSLHRQRRIRTSGFTLLEVVVTLVLLAIAAALVPPMFHRDAPNETVTTVLAAAREAAARRSQTLMLDVNPQGAWRLSTAAGSETLASGSLHDGTRSISVRVTPLGACFSSGAGIDAFTCSIGGTR